MKSNNNLNELVIPYMTHFEDAVKMILAEQAKGKRFFVKFNDKTFISGNLTEEGMYQTYYGHSKAEDQFIHKVIWTHPKFERFSGKMLDDYLEESRKEHIMPATMENVIEGLKFIAENHNNDNAIVVQKALIDYGFNFNETDIKRQDALNVNLRYAVKLFVEYRDSLYGSRAVVEKFLTEDDEESLYSYIRLLSNDPTYTKEYVDKKKQQSEIAKMSGEGLYEIFTDRKKTDYEAYCETKDAFLHSPERDIINAEELAESRKKFVMEPTKENVVDAIKYIAENTDIKPNQIVGSELIERGYNFTLDDINKLYDIKGSVYKGLSKGKIESGIWVIQSFRDSSIGSWTIKENLIDLDGEPSLYQFVRTVTGDETYTKEYVDSLKKSNLHK